MSFVDFSRQNVGYVVIFFCWCWVFLAFRLLVFLVSFYPDEPKSGTPFIYSYTTGTTNRDKDRSGRATFRERAL